MEGRKKESSYFTGVINQHHLKAVWVVVTALSLTDTALQGKDGADVSPYDGMRHIFSSRTRGTEKPSQLSAVVCYR